MRAQNAFAFQAFPPRERPLVSMDDPCPLQRYYVFTRQRDALRDARRREARVCVDNLARRGVLLLERRGGPVLLR